jgi:hypothetical protein
VLTLLGSKVTDFGKEHLLNFDKLMSA